jgi:hypothetical protein
LVNLADDLTGFVCQAVEKGAELDAGERGIFARVWPCDVPPSISFWLLRETAILAPAYKCERLCLQLRGVD